MKKTILIFGGLCAVILLLFQLERWSLFGLRSSENLYVVITGTIFLILGIVISRYFQIKNAARKRELRKSSLSTQELKVLHLMADGMSNREIAGELFIAETTVKSHVSKILEKLDARRRTQAVRIGKDLRII